ncbi:MAG: ATP-binding protein [Holophagae bacterium]|nr:ATP-binding protein [Holophagae bacterium]
MNTQYLEIVKLVERYPNLLTHPIKDKILERLSREYSLSAEEAAAFAYFFKRQLADNLNIDLKCIRDEFDISIESYGRLLKIVSRLKENGLLNLNPSDTALSKNPMYPVFDLDEGVFNRLVLGKDPWGELNPKEIYSVTDAAVRVLEQRENKYIDQVKCFIMLSEIRDKIPKTVPFSVVFKGLENTDLALIFYAIAEYLKGNDTSFASRFADDVLEAVSSKARFLANVQRKKLASIRRGWIELDEETTFVRDPMFRISEKAIEVLFMDGKRSLTTYRPQFCRHLKHEKIQSVQLFLTGRTADSIELLERSLTRRALSNLTARLKKKGMPTGITCIFHGLPGTGKTASVYELARRRKMDILHVDFANIRDKFVGESEKRLKAVFDEYRTARKRLNRIPILLFNEADALLGNRIAVSDSVDQMNNSMQNILLEQLEQFDGVLMATTNLIENMDTAFDRRFLFKVRFKRPDGPCRKVIWKSKLPSLKMNEAAQLSQLNLSGAQIENVARKLTMMEVIEGRQTSFGTILQLANEEANIKTDGKGGIGF